jgi:hypothetical protein
MPDLYKIGFTDRSPRQRAADLSNTSIPTPYEVIAHWEVENPIGVEKELHKLFSDKRVANNREFFRLTNENLYDISVFMEDYSYSYSFNYPMDMIIEGHYINQDEVSVKVNNNETNT